MKTRTRAFWLVALATLILAAPAGAALTVDDVLKLHRSGLEAATLVAVVEASGETFRLEAEEIIAMKEAGVPEAVIRAMVETALPREEEPTHRALVQEDGTILLTDEESSGTARDEPDPDRPHRSANVVPSRIPDPRAERTPIPAYAQSRIPLPEARVATYLPSPQVVPEDRGPYGIGYRWHPSWNDGRYRDAGFPLGADTRVGFRSASGYYFLPSSFGPNGPSSFGRFGFFLLPSPSLQQGVHLHRRRP